ncbi:hypothetical protein BV20DRAFT_956888 [Pilatotrama ljubarskyi]|nr:hypothetical protein BV20DRAFT_956888 [Pilatotrama ljubarskyi]
MLPSGQPALSILNLNTLGVYGVGAPDCFAHIVGHRLPIVEVIIYHAHGQKTTVVVVADAQALSKSLLWFNGAGTVHGGCLCYLIDKPCVRLQPSGNTCASFPLIALGIMHDINGVRVHQAINIFFHAPTAIDTAMRMTNTPVTIESRQRIMRSRCEVTDEEAGEMVASALLSKIMQPTLRNARLHKLRTALHGYRVIGRSKHQ